MEIFLGVVYHGKEQGVCSGMVSAQVISKKEKQNPGTSQDFA